MSWKWTGFLPFILLAAIGCSQSPPAENSPPPKDDSAEIIPAPKTVKKDPVQSPPEEIIEPEPPKPEEPLPKVDEELRRQVANRTSEDRAAREAAAVYLESRGGDLRLQLLAMMKDDETAVRRGAGFALMALFAPNDTRIAEAYSAALADSDSAVRSTAIQALARLPNSDLQNYFEKLTAILDFPGETAGNRQAVVQLLGKLKSDAAAVLPQLANAAATDADPAIRKACLFAVTQIAEPKEAVEIVKKSLQDNDPDVRRVAIVRLQRLGPAASPAIDSLAKTLADEDSEVRDAATEALVAIGAASVPVLTKELESQNVFVRRHALFALGRLGPLAKSAQLSISKLLEDDDEQVRKLAKFALASIDSRSP